MKNKIHPIQLIRAVIQLISFITVPALFITILSSLGGIVTSIISGNFVLSENLGRIILVLSVFLVTLVFGRYFCGFICSFGAMQDLLNAVGKLIPFRVKVSEKTDKWLKLLKYAVLAFVVAGVWGFSVTGDTVWSPWTVFGIYASPDAWSSLEYFLTIGGVLLLLIIIGSLFIERFFCKYLCPLGALFTLVSGKRIITLKRGSDKCGNCRLCTSKCSMSIPLYKYDEVTSGECINCMKCTEICTKENISADTLTSISGALAVTAIAGLYYAGVLTYNPELPEENVNGIDIVSETDIVSEIEEKGPYADGTYTGTGNGFRGEVEVAVTVENGDITDITIISYKDDQQFFGQAENGIISEILQSQNTEVDAVSGATFSSNGIIEAVADALGIDFTNPNSSAERGHGRRHSH